MRLLPVAATVLFLVLLTPIAYASETATDLKSQLARARMEAAGLVEQSTETASSPAIENEKDEMAPVTAAPTTRTPLASMQAPKDDLLMDAPKAIASKPLPEEKPPVVASPVLPPAMPEPVVQRTIIQTPPAPPPIIAPVQQMKIVQAPAPAPAAVTSPQPAPPRVKTLPQAASRVGGWKMRTVQGAAGDKSGGDFCLLQASFDNSLTLMLGQRADGFATLGVNYGLDMLQIRRDYRVNVATDNGFDEDFTGYAENAKTIIAQMGRKASFFQALAGARQVAVTMPGVVSVFDVSGIIEALPEFEKCAGVTPPAPVMAPPPSAAVPVTPVVAAPMPEPTPAPVATPAPVPAPAPVVAQAPPAPVAMPEPIPAPAPAPAPAMTNVAPQPIHGLLFDDKTAAPKTQAPVVTPPPAMPLPITQPVTQNTPPHTSSWTDEAVSLLQRAGIMTAPRTQNGAVTWQDGAIKGSATQMAEKDVLDAADAALARAQQACAGSKFVNPIALRPIEVITVKN